MERRGIQNDRQIQAEISEAFEDFFSTLYRIAEDNSLTDQEMTVLVNQNVGPEASVAYEKWCEL